MWDTAYVMDEQPDRDDQIDSLEDPATVVEPAPGSASPNAAGGPTAATPPPAVEVTRRPTSPPRLASDSFLQRLIRHFNIYLLMFVILLIIAVGTGVVFYLKAKTTTSSPSAQSLTPSQLSQLSSGDLTVGQAQNTLSVQSNAVFAGNVLVRNNLQIAGTLQVGSSVSINGVHVTGNSTFDDVQIAKSLALTGNGSIQGQLNVQQSLSVNSTATFAGAVSAPSLTISSLQLNGDLDLTHHISAGGSTPTLNPSSNLGSGGTASVSGSDTAGSITLNTGTSPAAGCLVTLTFASVFHSTPHVVVTPVGASAAGLGYYTSRSTTTFSICASNAPSSSVTFGFDYYAFD